MFKNIVLAALLCVVTSHAYATDPIVSAGAIALAGANAAAYGGEGGTGGVGNGGNTDIDVDRAASSAIAPSVGTASKCQIATPQSIAASILIASGSLTTGVIYNDLCFALELGQLDVAERLMCKRSKEYAEANPVGCNPATNVTAN